MNTDLPYPRFGTSLKQLGLGLGILCLHTTLQAAPLNDSGITWGGNYPEGNNPDCSGETIAEQDCAYGRDAAAAAGQLQKIGGGQAGFDFTKLDANGNDLAETATAWSCVRDNVTGLIWEVKTDDGGLHDKDDEYNWYNTDTTNNGGFEGYADDDGAICYGYQAGNPATYCNTQAFVARVNAKGWCGANDWRMPHLNELYSIVDQGRINPSIDINYFPNTPSDFVWSGSPNAFYSNYAWGVYFDNGSGSGSNRSYSYHVRLVRGGQ